MEREVLGLTFRPMDDADRKTFQGAAVGTLVHWIRESTVLLLDLATPGRIMEFRLNEAGQMNEYWWERGAINLEFSDD